MKISCKEHALACHSFNTGGGPEVFTSTTISKKCGEKTSSGGQERYILIIIRSKLPYHCLYQNVGSSNSMTRISRIMS